MTRQVIYSCPFVPAELIAACGFVPSRVTPVRPSIGSSANGICCHAAAFTDFAIERADAAAVIFTSTCDQMRRSAEIVARQSDKPVFLMNVPHTWQSVASYKLYMDELRRLTRFLASRGGSVPSNETLAEVMSVYNQARAHVRDSRHILTARQYSELIAAFNRNPGAYTGLGSPTGPADVPQGVPVALIGGPLVRESYRIFDHIELAGGHVALDATKTGERTLPAPFDRRLLREDPIGVLADSYFGSIPDPARRPNSEFYKCLAAQVSERGIRGIILLHYLWCDNWRAEARRISEWSGLPFLHLDIGDSGLDLTRTRLRLEAFFEVLNR